MPSAADLTPHLAAAMPRAAALVPWLLIWGVTVIVLALAASVFIVRNAAWISADRVRASRSPEGAAFLRDTERRLRRGRRRHVLGALAGAVALWALTWLAGGSNPLVAELLAVLVAAWLGPVYVALRIFEGAMARAAERVQGRPVAPSSPSPRGGGRG